MDNLENNPYLDRPVQRRYSDHYVQEKPVLPVKRKASRKPTRDVFYNTAKERNAAEALEK